MRQRLLITTAIAGLLAGTMFAAAQNMPKQGGAEGGAPSGQMQRKDQDQGKQAPQGRQNQREQGKQGTTGQGGPQAGEGKQGQRDQGKQGDRERGKQGTTGQGREDRDSKQGQREQGKQGAQPRQNEQNGQARQPSTQGKANITDEQRTRLRERVLAHGPRISNNVRISINVGTVIPTSVRVVAVPEEIIEIYPNYRGYFYFVYEDEIVIVDRAHHIVAVIAV
jgi:Protein of unknown function (DUF1236)